MTCFYSKDFTSSAFTDVENVFICQYMPFSSGEAVKVYLYGLYLCKFDRGDRSVKDVADTLKLSEEEVLSCFKYWEEFGLVSVLSSDPLSVEYFPVKATSLSKPRKYKTEKYSEFTKAVQQAVSSRMIGTNEYTEYFNVMETYGIKPEAMIMIVNYCVDLKGADIGYKYITRVAKNFAEKGVVTVEKVEKELSSYVLRTAEIEKIFKALSLKRKPEIEDLNFYKKWTGDLGFETEAITFAASKVKKGGMETLDRLLNELYSVKCFSVSEMKGYFDKKQAVYDLAIKINKTLSVYTEVMETVIDVYTNKWLSYGYSDETLLFIASECFKSGKNSLKAMDELIEYLRERGFIDLSSVSDYFGSLKTADEFISKFLATAGVNRRPNAWDRENLATWKSWNFGEDMILEAAKLAAGKNSPVAYVNGVLSNWKNKGVFTAESITEKPSFDGELSPEAYNREYEKRRAKAASVAQKNLDAAMEIEGFAADYERTFSIEKDLAFAEISGQNDKLAALESEKAQLNAEIEKKLASIGLKTKDLTPVYVCEKCKDTGYVGTHRCDCFDKK